MPDPIVMSSDAELRALVERALSSGYELDREIGRGGMGIVFRGRDRRLKRTVAIKVLPPELAYRTEIKSRFLREAETAAQLNHPHIVPIYAVDERGGLVYFVMTCVEGPTLADRMEKYGPLPFDESRRILAEVADALAYAHSRGVVHRDIKPDNILLDSESGRAMVTDFGIARAAEGGDSRLTATGVAIGTPAFMSPEQAAGDREIDGRSDIYSLGIVAYQMLCGDLPFQASNTPTMLMKHLTERPRPLVERRHDIPRDLGTIVMTALEKEPENRFPTAQALAAALRGEGPLSFRDEEDDSSPQRRSREEASGRPAWDDRPARGITYDERSSRGPAWEDHQPRGVATRTPTSEELVERATTADDLVRWNSKQVVEFRKAFANFAFVNAAIVIAAILFDLNLTPVTVIWGIILAAKYGKLWSAGFDWRDVFKQPRDRALVDVASETVEELSAIFDENKRKDRRRRRREKRHRQALPAPERHAALPATYGRHATTVQQAQSDRDEIARLVLNMPRKEQSRFADLIPAADGLVERVRALAASIVDMERTDAVGAEDELERQISELEAQANPLDGEASEQRVRRLALLKRQRRALGDTRRKRSETMGKLDSCALALQNMRLDLVRLGAGGVRPTMEHITQLTARARDLAAEVDAAVYGADEVRRVVGDNSRGADRR